MSPYFLKPLETDITVISVVIKYKKTNILKMKVLPIQIIGCVRACY